MTQTVQQALTQANALLAAAGINGAPRDARLLMAAALGVDPSRVTLHLHDPLDEQAAIAFATAITRRSAHEPVSHILGRREFYGRSFKVTPDVLDPRPETEALVAEALARPFGTVLDLGTGSGAILVTCLAERPSATGVGADLSQAALRIAHHNAAAHGVSDRCTFGTSDWFSVITGRFDLILSNPPYIAAAEMPDLEPDLCFEPRMALTDEDDGLSAYRQIAACAADHLADGGRVLVEIGYRQGPDVSRIFAENGFKTTIVMDLDNRPRVVAAQLA